MGVEQFHHQEHEYAAYMRQGVSFVCNGLDMGTEWHRLHQSDCPMLHRNKDELPTSVAKACSRDLKELIRWLTMRFGGEGEGFQFCYFCRQAGRL
jgi:hypothetical protein